MISYQIRWIRNFSTFSSCKKSWWEKCWYCSIMWTTSSKLAASSSKCLLFLIDFFTKFWWNTLQIKAAEVQRKYSRIAVIYYRQQQSAVLSFHTNCSGSLRSQQWKYLLCRLHLQAHTLGKLIESKSSTKVLFSNWPYPFINYQG